MRRTFSAGTTAPPGNGGRGSSSALSSLCLRPPQTRGACRTQVPPVWRTRWSHHAACVHGSDAHPCITVCLLAESIHDFDVDSLSCRRLHLAAVEAHDNRRTALLAKNVVAAGSAPKRPAGCSEQLLDDTSELHGGDSALTSDFANDEADAPHVSSHRHAMSRDTRRPNSASARCMTS